VVKEGFCTIRLTIEQKPFHELLPPHRKPFNVVGNFKMTTKMNRALLYIFTFFSITSFGQSPHLQGTIDLDISKGFVGCHFKITKTPQKGSYSIFLNKGFNLKYFKTNGKILNVESKGNAETIEYNLYAVNDTLRLRSLEDITVDYVGAFPTFSRNDSTTSDDMGVIAIKNHILRATVQSVFVPELVERANKKHISTFTYDIIVNCSEPETVYLNGCEPQTGTTLHFINKTPLDFLLYAGKYNVQHQGNLYLLNTTLDKKYVSVLAKTTEQISQYYSKVMGIGYDANVFFAQIFSLGPKNQYIKWAFTVTPTIVMDVNELDAKIDLKTQSIYDVNTFTIIAHEMAHKYFMQQLNAIGTKNLWRFYHETLAQYLSFKAVERLISATAYQNILNKYIFTEENKKKEFVPFNEIEHSERDLTNASYYYYPLYLIGFEKMFGVEKAFKLLRQLVLDKDQFTFDTEYFKKQALQTGISQQDFDLYEIHYLKSKNCLNKF
jgi:hypothetical protein